MISLRKAAALMRRRLSFAGRNPSAEEFAQGLLHSSYGDYLYAVEEFQVEALYVVFRHEYSLEAEFLGLGYALLDAAYGTYLAAQAHLAAHAGGGVDSCVNV